MDSVTVTLTGQFPFVILAAAVAAFPISRWLLWLYRRRVMRTMSRRARVDSAAIPAEAARSPAPPAVPKSPKLALSEWEANRLTQEGTSQLFDWLRASPWKGARVYALGGVSFTLLMTLAVLMSSGIEFLPVRVLLVFWVYGWPIVLTVNLVGASTRRDRWCTVLAYVIGLVLLSAVAVTTSSVLTPAQVAILWMITNLPATLLLFAFLARPIRAVGPLVLTFMIVAVTGALLALSVVASNEAVLRAVTGIGFTLGATATGTFVAIVVVGFAGFAVIGWLTVGWLRRGYVAKRLSDQSISMDALWLLFGVIQSVSLAFEGALWILSGVFAFIAYKLTVWLGFRWREAQTREGRVPNTRLLLLRVFSLGERSERLFDGVSKHWRYLGNVQLIAGPDLAMTTVEPHEFLSFVSGRLASAFIDGPAALDRRMKDLDVKPDLDGRFRVNDFFCYDNTWEMVLTRLVNESDVVMMDVRGFTPQNAGCIHELQELINVFPLPRVVLVHDGTTDLSFLRNTLARAWDNINPRSPNVATTEAEVKLFFLTGLDSHPLHRLLACLTRAAAGESV